MASDTQPPLDKKTGKVREKVQLQPGFHLVDWMRLMKSSSINSMTSGGRQDGEGLRKVSLRELSQHSSEFDCWTAYKGKVYDITKYIAFHPGGKPKLMLGAGKDCTDLFDKFHRWVNIDNILGKCVIGVLGSEEEIIVEEDEEEEGYGGKEQG